MKEHKIHLAGCIILDSQSKILLLHRNTPVRQQWETPGGKIEAGETVEQTAVREIEEEIGVKVKIIKKLGHMDFIEDDFTMGYTWLQAEIKEGQPKIQEEIKYL